MLQMSNSRILEEYETSTTGTLQQKKRSSKNIAFLRGVVFNDVAEDIDTMVATTREDSEDDIIIEELEDDQQ